MSINMLSINKNGQGPDEEPVVSQDDEATLDDKINVPELPKYIRPDFSLGEEAGEWIGDYLEYASTISPLTPREFHLGACLWTISVGIARRLFVKLPFTNLFPNIFVLCIGSSTLYRKTTGQDIAIRLVRDVYPYLLAPQDATPEALISDMSGIKPSNYDELPEKAKVAWDARRNFSAQKGLALDEFSSLMHGMEKDYNQGIGEMLLRGYDCAPEFERLTRGMGLTTIYNIYSSIFGSSTPVALSTFFQKDKYWTNGFWPRFFLITPVERPVWKVAKEMKRPTILVERLQGLQRKLPAAKWPDPTKALEVKISSEAKKMWGNYSKALSYDLITDQLDDRLSASYGRFPIHVLKVATLLSAIDANNSWPPTITLPYLIKAIQICEEYRTSLHRVIAYRSEQPIANNLFRVIKLVAKYQKDGASARDIASGMRDRRREEIDELIEDLQRMRIIRVIETKPTRAGGRPTTKYVLGTL